MKFLVALIFAVFLANVVFSQGNKYFNFVGSYSNNNCVGQSNGVGYVFLNLYCYNSINQSWNFNISSNGEGYVTGYSETDGYSCGQCDETLGTQVFENNKCQITPEFSNETTPGHHSSIIQFTNVPVYESNSVVVSTFYDDKCHELLSSVTYSNGLSIQLEDNSIQTYTCKSGQPFIKTCLNGGTQCTTKSAALKCSYQTSIFCTK